MDEHRPADVTKESYNDEVIAVLVMDQPRALEIQRQPGRRNINVEDMCEHKALTSESSKRVNVSWHLVSVCKGREKLA